MTHVRHFMSTNLAGNLVGTVKVAQAATGNYPVGSVLQLVPTEVMVKREQGFNATTHDWSSLNSIFPRMDQRSVPGDFKR